MIVAFFLSKKHSQKIKFAFFLSSIYTLSFVAIFTETRLSESAELIDYIYYFYTFIMLNFFTGNLFAKNIYFNLVFISLWLADTFIFTLSLPHISYIFTILGIVLFTVFTDEKRMRENTVLKNAAEKEISKTQQLLTQMMPPNALTNLEKGNQVMDRLNQVTLMFADIVGFTAWSSTRSPFEVVNMLSELFTRFDKMSVENNVYKVHTIGDCYVAMGYVNDNIRNPAKEAVNVIKFASGLIELIKETNEQCGIELGMRIGIHTGEITGGITGTKIVRYDVYGEDVQIANKMESNGMSGRVAVSETTKVLIDSYMPQMFLFTEGKEVKCAKDSGSIKLYFYEGQSGE
jgi:phospholipid-translocating ATPase